VGDRYDVKNIVATVGHGVGLEVVGLAEVGLVVVVGLAVGFFAPTVPARRRMTTRTRVQECLFES
jgi:hypothetical protein